MNILLEFDKYILILNNDKAINSSHVYLISCANQLETSFSLMLKCTFGGNSDLVELYSVSS